MLLREFDADPSAVINPKDIYKSIPGFPKVFVSCFAKDTFDRLRECYSWEVITSCDFANLKVLVYKINIDGVDIGLVNAYVGAPGCVALFDFLHACGMEQLVIFGTCGVLDKEIKDTSIIVPTSALRDEGTSFHYAPPSDEITVNTRYLTQFIRYLDSVGVSHSVGKVWTTDAIYRETKGKLLQRKQAGCIAVDMECSAMAALAQFRGFDILHFFYSADNLDGESWDMRSLSNHHKLDEKHRIGELALGFALKLTQTVSLVVPRLDHQKQAEAYYKEHIEAGECSLSGSNRYHHSANYEEWLQWITKNQSEYSERYVPSLTYFGVVHGEIVGMINIRLSLNESLLNYGGHIGYGVRPSQRGRGIATEMLGLALDKCRSLGMKRVLLTCNDDNIGSRKTILKHGGVFENTFTEDNGTVVERYWIGL